ncbi:MAG: Gfo/Idh/MocA family oxidoreductase [Nocardioidaceae bacterium]
MSAVLRVGVVGIGDIAEKAYLPVLSALPGVELALVTRSVDTLARVGAQYGVARRTTRLEDLLDAGIDAAFVHAATQAHAGIVERLLVAGVPVLVDKPLAPTVAEATRLVEEAERRSVSLAVGFNRRFAPAYASLSGLRPSVVLMSKHRVALPEQPRRFVFDDLIHVVDTLRSFLPSPTVELSVWCEGGGGLLRTVTLAMRGEGTTALGVMHRDSGAEEEVLEVLGHGYQHRVVDLAASWHAEADGPAGVRRAPHDGWATVPTVRGFTAMCEWFLAAVRAGRVLSARDALATHEVCEQVVAVAETATGTTRTAG